MVGTDLFCNIFARAYKAAAVGRTLHRKGLAMGIESNPTPAADQLFVPVAATGLKWMAAATLFTMIGLLGLAILVILGPSVGNRLGSLPTLSIVAILCTGFFLIGALVSLIGRCLCWLHPEPYVRAAFIGSTLVATIAIAMLAGALLHTTVASMDSASARSGASRSTIEAARILAAMSSVLGSMVVGIVSTVLSVVGMIAMAKQLRDQRQFKSANYYLVYLVALIGIGLAYMVLNSVVGLSIGVANAGFSGPIAGIFMLGLSAISEYWFLKLCWNARYNLLQNAGLIVQRNVPIPAPPHPLD